MAEIHVISASAARMSLERHGAGNPQFPAPVLLFRAAFRRVAGFWASVALQPVVVWTQL